MANHYLQFSEVLPHLTEEEERWLRHQLEIVWVFQCRTPDRIGEVSEKGSLVVIGQHLCE